MINPPWSTAAPLRSSAAPPITHHVGNTGTTPRARTRARSRLRYPNTKAPPPDHHHHDDQSVDHHPATMIDQPTMVLQIHASAAPRPTTTPPPARTSTQRPTTRRPASLRDFQGCPRRRLQRDFLLRNRNRQWSSYDLNRQHHRLKPEPTATQPLPPSDCGTPRSSPHQR